VVTGSHGVSLWEWGHREPLYGIARVALYAVNDNASDPGILCSSVGVNIKFYQVN